MFDDAYELSHDDYQPIFRLLLTGIPFYDNVHEVVATLDGLQHTNGVVQDPTVERQINISYTVEHKQDLIDMLTASMEFLGRELISTEEEFPHITLNPNAGTGEKWNEPHAIVDVSRYKLSGATAGRILSSKQDRPKWLKKAVRDGSSRDQRTLIWLEPDEPVFFGRIARFVHVTLSRAMATRRDEQEKHYHLRLVHNDLLTLLIRDEELLRHVGPLIEVVQEISVVHQVARDDLNGRLLFIRPYAEINDREEELTVFQRIDACIEPLLTGLHKGAKALMAPRDPLERSLTERAERLLRQADSQGTTMPQASASRTVHATRSETDRITLTLEVPIGTDVKVRAELPAE